jgi:hypothetical protein
VIDQERNVLAPLPQRREVDRHDVEAVIQIVAKGLPADGFLEVVAGGGHESGVHRDRAR